MIQVFVRLNKPILLIYRTIRQLSEAIIRLYKKIYFKMFYESCHFERVCRRSVLQNVVMENLPQGVIVHYRIELILADLID